MRLQSSPTLREARAAAVAVGLMAAAVACGGAGTSVGEGISVSDSSTTGGTGEGTTGGETTDSGSTATTGTTGGTGGAECTPDTYANYAMNFFATNCVTCHSHDHTAYSTYTGVAGDATNIPRQISQGSMPLGATLAASDKSRILAWFTCNLPM